jgi:hypothetical protein
MPLAQTTTAKSASLERLYIVGYLSYILNRASAAGSSLLDIVDRNQEPFGKPPPGSGALVVQRD